MRKSFSALLLLALVVMVGCSSPTSPGDDCDPDVSDCIQPTSGS